MDITKENIFNAYKWLKRENYYDTVNLFLREKIAVFESVNDFDSKLEEIYINLSQINNVDNEKFKELLSKISFKILPKNIEKCDNTSKNNSEKKIFLSNLRTAEKYSCESINYFIDAPIEIHILSILWSWRVGKVLDNQLIDNCLGYRINKASNPFTLFRYYLHQYNKWRDEAINVGINTLENKNDILLVALDIKECFYNLECNWDEIRIQAIQNNIDEGVLLTNVLEEIHFTYQKLIERHLIKSHYSDKLRYPENIYPKNFIPIGLFSSGILANWELNRFDITVKNNLRPVYYGRYVDDVLIVINNPNKKTLSTENIDEIIDEFFKKTEIIDPEIIETTKVSDNKKDRERFLKLKGYNFLSIQEKKLILHYYDYKSSWAGLTKFKNELDIQSSIFNFLPEDFNNRDLANDAYDIEYEGSINKLRSVIGVKENSTKLVTYLFNQQLRKWLLDKDVEKSTINQLKRFFKGLNILNNFRIWDRVLSLFVSETNLKDYLFFYKEIRKTINDIECSFDSSLSGQLIEDLQRFLRIASSISLALIGETEIHKDELDDIYSLANSMRKTQLTRHQYVSLPLLEFTEFPGNLTSKNEEVKNKNLLKKNLEFSPRFIHFDDYQLFCFYNTKILDYLDLNINKIEKKYKEDFISPNNLPDIFSYDEKRIVDSKEIPVENFNENDEPSNKKINDFEIRLLSIENKTPDEEGNFLVGISNIKIPESKFLDNIMPPRKTKLDESYHQNILHLINEACKKPKCDLLVLPEMSIPFCYLPFMANQARRKNIGLVFGLEHKVIDKECFNLVVSILPYEIQHGYKNCILTIRNKNHYAPIEEFLINNYGLNIPDTEKIYYKYFWRDCYFSVYNCFELTNIIHRGVFRSKIDLLIGISWNKDINYYSNILDSAARDIHCYVANINTSQFGDSKIISPKSTEVKNILQISGGENCVLIKGKIDIKSLRNFQKHDYDPKDDTFKPTPAGFDHEYVRKNRI